MVRETSAGKSLHVSAVEETGGCGGERGINESMGERHEIPQGSSEELSESDASPESVLSAIMLSGK